MTSRIVRGVDWGNIQRSPTFQVIFNTFTKPSELKYPIIFDSAGIVVDKILANESPVTAKLSIIDTGLGYDIIPEDIKSEALRLVESWKGFDASKITDEALGEITGIYAQVKDIVHTRQMEYRNTALVEAGVAKEDLPGMRIPYRHHPDLKIILALDRVVIPKLEEYYREMKDVSKPKIILYGDLVGREPLKDTHKGRMETARSQVKYFLDTRTKALEEIGELLKQ